MTDCPPCPQCGRMPSPSGRFQAWDLRALPAVYTSDASPVSTVPILTFCSEACCDAFFEKAAEELKAERSAGR